jgi:uncharacterized membrane protein YbaN (DUF454 family)
LIRFTAAVHHHLAAIKIQRAFKQARAIAMAKKQMSSVFYIQVSIQIFIMKVKVDVFVLKRLSYSSLYYSIWMPVVAG